ncbi:MAG: carboxyl transferase [Eubacterium sp.]|nr:carboxyl transferase [Eubacterium sp.]
MLLDDNSFVEIGAFVKARSTDFNLKDVDTPSDGVVTGYGLIDGQLVYVYSQDSSVLGGSVGEMHAKKILNIYNMAMKTGAPVIGLIDSAGLRLQESDDGLNAFGRIYHKQAMASGVIPQISAIFGKCGGGLSVVAGMSDFTFMESENAELFVNSPNAIDENRKEVCDTASAKFQSEEAGNVDFVGTEAEVISGIRDLIGILPSDNESGEVIDMDMQDDLNRSVEGIDTQIEDTAVAMRILSDEGFVVEVKKAYAPEMFTGFIKLDGATVGVVANRTKVYDDEMNVTAEFDAKLTYKGCEKAAKFVEFCDAFDISILTLTNIDGFATTKCQEAKVAKSTAKLVYAFANATVPKVNVIVGKAFGSSYVAMNSKTIGADIVYAWPSAKIGMMDATAAVKIIYDGQDVDFATKTAEYENLQNSVEATASRGYVDSIIEPVDTRKYVIGAFEMLFTKFEERPGKKHGTV